MTKKELCQRLAKMTIAVGSLTGFSSELTRFARNHSVTNLCYIYMIEFKTQELYERLDSLILELEQIESVEYIFSP
jgi:hypothetical protein